MNRTLLSIVLGLVFTLSLVPRARSAEHDILAHGSADMYWIARVEPVAGQAAVMQTTVQSRSVPADAPWKRIALIRARVVSLANRGNQLAVLQESGDWMLVWAGGSSTGTVPEDGAKLVELAGERDALWAIAMSGRGRTPTSATATQPAATLPAGTRSLYALEQGRWTHVSMLPVETADARNLSLVISESVPTVAALLGDERALVWSWNKNIRGWDAPQTVQTGPGASAVKLLSGLRRPALWVSQSSGAGAICWRESAWSSPATLSPSSDIPQGSTLDLTVAGQSLRMVSWAGPGSKIVEFAFGPDGKPRRSDVQPVPSIPADPNQFGWVSVVLGGVLLMVLFNALRARTIVQPETLEQARITLAPLGRRFIAAFIDALPIIGTALVIAIRLRDQDPFNPDLYLQFQIPMSISTGVYMLHTLASELLWGWTIGKRVCGLRVTMLDGSPPTRRAIVIRNLLRIIDVFFGFPPLLVLISPLRQRVGDLAAETIVVVAGSATKPEDKDVP